MAKRRLAGNSQTSQPKKRQQGGKGKPFKPDDPRINRNGVPAEALEFQRRLREALADELSKTSELDPSGKQTKFERIVEQIVLRAQGGSEWAAEMVFDRIGGKPIQPHEIGGTILVELPEILNRARKRAKRGDGSGQPAGA